MSGEVFGVATVGLAMLIGVLQLLADNRGRLRRELAAGIVRSEWHMEERHNGVFMVHAKRGEVLRLVDYEARIEGPAESVRVEKALRRLGGGSAEAEEADEA